MADVHFLRAVAGCGMMNHGCDKQIRKELGIVDINTVIKSCENKWLERLERMPEFQIPKLLYQYKEKDTEYE